MGRCLVVTRDVQPHEVLFCEQPLVSCQFSWNKRYGYSACDQCLRPLETAVENVRRLAQEPAIELARPDLCATQRDRHDACPGCAAAYCSSGCRQMAWERYHRTLCPAQLGPTGTANLEALDQAWREMHYPPETSSVMLLVRLAAMVHQSEAAAQKDELLGRLAHFCHATSAEAQQLSLKLMGDRFESQVAVLLQLFRAAIFDEKLESWYSPAGFRSLLALVGRNSQGVATSPFSVWVRRATEMAAACPEERARLEQMVSDLYDRVEKAAGCCFMDNEGVALYERQACVNHSCEPNAEVVFAHNDTTLSLVATQALKAGEQVFISYLDEAVQGSGRHTRQRWLRENYLFTCRCARCLRQTDDASVTSEDEDDSEEEEEESMDT